MNLKYCTAGFLFACLAVNLQAAPTSSEMASFRVETVAEGLEVPWALAFLPDGSALVVERELGKLHRLNPGSGELVPITGLPPMLRSGKISAGLFDVRPHPDFARNRLLYLAYAEGTEEASGLVVDRVRLAGNALEDRQRLFTATPRTSLKWHYGGRLAITGGYLYITTGDGYDHSAQSQALDSHLGKILRLHDDGSIPDDNPFRDRRGALPEIYAYGVRNPQGMAVHPKTGAIWINEHGPQGGDEINLIRSGVNYGWPVITYGEEYGGGPIGDGIQRQAGLAQPVYYWVPSIAPSGLTFYEGSAFPDWEGSLFSGALALKHVNRLAVEEERVMHEERLLADRDWRVRFVEVDSSGHLYFGVDAGKILRLVPEASAPE